MIATILFANILELLIFTFFYKSLVSPNNNNKHEYTIVYTLCFLTKCIFNFFNNIQINIAISFSIYLILLLKFSDSKLIYKLLSLSLYEGLSIFSESITYHLFQLFPLANENELLQMFFSKFVLLLLILIPNLLNFLTHIMGISIASNFIFALIIAVLIFINISLTIIISGQNDKIRLLIQEVSLIKKDDK